MAQDSCPVASSSVSCSVAIASPISASSSSPPLSLLSKEARRARSASQPSHWAEAPHPAAPWDGALRYDDPRFIATMQWLASLPERGLSGTRASTGRIGGTAMST